MLAGGTGSRLRPITYTSAKQLVPIANKPILFYGLESIARCGIRDVGMIVGDTAAEVKAVVGNGSQFGMEVTYIHQEKPLGLAHAVKVARDYLGDDDFVMYLGDNFILDGIEGFVSKFKEESSGSNAQILLAKVTDPHRFGVAVLDHSGSVVKLVEKPKDPPSDLALVGVYIFDKEIHRAVSEITPSQRGELEITDAIDWLIEHGCMVKSTIIEGFWKDLGEPEALLEGNRLALDSVENLVEGTITGNSAVQGRVSIGPGAQIIDSVIRGPVIIGENTRIVSSFIGPYTSVGSNCDVERSELEYSIVLTESTIKDIERLEGSIIGRGASVSRRSSKPAALRLVVGDNSTVELSR